MVCSGRISLCAKFARTAVYPGRRILDVVEVAGRAFVDELAGEVVVALEVGDIDEVDGGTGNPDRVGIYDDDKCDRRCSPGSAGPGRASL